MFFHKLVIDINGFPEKMSSSNLLIVTIMEVGVCKAELSLKIISSST
jgi:hypothetical protein